MSDYRTVARIGEIPEGEGRAFAVNGAMVAVFNLGDMYAAIGDTCPHMGASLAGGYLDGRTVTCPWHAWRFCVTDGAWMDSPQSKLRTASYPVRVEGDAIQVAVPNPPKADDPGAASGDRS